MGDYSWVQNPEFDYTSVYRQFGNGIYLAPGETFESVVAQDAEILAMHGVTHEEVGESLVGLFATVDTFLSRRAPKIEEPIPGIILTKKGSFMGEEWCPYLPGVSAGFDWGVYTKDLPNGNKAHHPENGPTFVSPMLPEMIKQLGFFEGTVYYGIKPEWAIAVHRLMTEYAPKPYVPRYTVDAWDTLSSFHRSMEKVSADIKSYCFTTEEFMPGVVAYLAKGDLAPHGWDDDGIPQFEYKYNRDSQKHRKAKTWATFVPQADALLQPDTTLGGMPFGENCRTELQAGKTYYVRHFPFYEKQVA